ncbi:hypothetical protein BDZ97DRAFT_1753024 [Flammula alnicola]|nr:hypothetical protein BDZ97DRAFT_1753024 [Flammula alnicola]
MDIDNPGAAFGNDLAAHSSGGSTKNNVSIEGNSHREASLSAPLTEVSDVPNNPGPSQSSPSTKRGRGRPRGSRNKSTSMHAKASVPAVKRPVGRPRGSGPKQRAQAEVDNPGSASNVTVSQKPLGRPRKAVPPTTIEFGRIVC